LIVDDLSPRPKSKKAAMLARHARKNATDLADRVHFKGGWPLTTDTGARVGFERRARSDRRFSSS
jgi:hypothetical protein